MRTPVLVLIPRRSKLRVPGSVQNADQALRAAARLIAAFGPADGSNMESAAPTRPAKHVRMMFDGWHLLDEDDAADWLPDFRACPVRLLAQLPDAGCWPRESLPEGICLAEGRPVWRRPVWRPDFLGGITLSVPQRKRREAGIRRVLTERRDTHWAVAYVVHF